MEYSNYSDQMLTGTTTAKKMTKTEINDNKMFAIKANIEKTVDRLRRFASSMKIVLMK